MFLKKKIFFYIYKKFEEILVMIILLGMDGFGMWFWNKGILEVIGDVFYCCFGFLYFSEICIMIFYLINNII